MFHRVKSEGQSVAPSSTSTVSEKAGSATPQAELEIETPDAQDAEERAQTSTDVKTVKEPTPPSSTKETEAMTEQDNATPEQEETTAPAAMGSYQRPGQAPVRSAGGYPGSSSYPGIVAGASEASESDRRLTIGPGITMSGEIEACDYLLVEGTVEAALKGANILEIAESGTFYGTVEINEANIAGRFEGDITVNGRLTISSGGTVTGSISYKEIEIEAGAVIDGKLTPLSAVAAAPAKKPQAATKAAAPKPAPAKVEKQPEPANSDGELFSKAAASGE